MASLRLVEPPVTERMDVVDPFIGRSVGNYRIERKLGQGAQGAVYRLCHHDLPNTYLVLKVLQGGDGSSQGATTRDRFRQEALAAALVGSHRVVKPIDVGQFSDGVPYILMEYVPGCSLAEALRESGPMPVARALRIALRIAGTMTVAHARGIVHRDLKPGNVMITPDGEQDLVVRILDFGVARVSGETKVAHTVEHSVFGTPGYMPPEAWAGVAVDGRADVFALGVMLHEMLTGCLPFAAPDQERAMVALLTEARLPVAANRPATLDHVPAALDAIIDGAVTRRASERYTMAQLLEALDATLAGIEGRSAAAPQRARSNAVEGLFREAPTLSASTDEVGAFLDKLDSRIEAAARAVAPAQTPKSRVVAEAPVSESGVFRGLKKTLVAALALVVLGGAAIAMWPREKTDDRHSGVRDSGAPASARAVFAAAVVDGGGDASLTDAGVTIATHEPVDGGPKPLPAVAPVAQPSPSLLRADSQPSNFSDVRTPPQKRRPANKPPSPVTLVDPGPKSPDVTEEPVQPPSNIEVHVPPGWIKWKSTVGTKQ